MKEFDFFGTNESEDKGLNPVYEQILQRIKNNKGANICLLIDVSKSMNQKIKLKDKKTTTGLEVTKVIAKQVVDILTEEQTLECILFDSGTRIIFTGGRSKDEMKNSIDKIVANGAAKNLIAALTQTMKIVSDHKNKRPQTILFFTDGINDPPLPDEVVILNIIGVLRATECRIESIVIGNPNKLNVPLLRKISFQKDGAVAVITD